MRKQVLSILVISAVIMFTTIMSSFLVTLFQPTLLYSTLGDMPQNTVAVTVAIDALSANQSFLTTSAIRNPARIQKLFKDLQNYSAASSPDDVILNTTASIEYPQVCFYGSTRLFFDENTTKSFVMNLLTFLRDISLRSYNEALIGKNKIHVLIPISSYKPHFESLQELKDFLKPVVDTYAKLNVDFSPNAHRVAAKNFRKTDCQWVISAKLDADDVVFPGYLDWIVQKVIPTLDRGAVVGGRFLPRLEIGFDRCVLATNSVPRYFWSGLSTGQTRVFRRDVFKALGMPFEASNHTSALAIFRRQVFLKILKRKPPKILLSKMALNFSFQESWDAEMENITGIRMVEPTLAREPFGPPGLYIVSPLSGHFNYEKIVKASRCTDAEWSRVWDDIMGLNAIKSNMDFALKTIQQVNFSFYDTCKSHAFLKKTFNREKQACFFGNATTCEEMEAKFREALAGAS